MMNKSKLILIALFMLAILSFTLQTIADSTDGNTTVDDIGQADPITIELTKATFDVNETLTGTLRLNLSEYLAPNREIKVRLISSFRSSQKILRLGDALSNSSIAFTLAGETKTLGTRESSKTLAFVDGGEHSIAVKIPQYANVESIDMDISAPSDSTLTNVTMDAAGDGKLDWLYLGDFIKWKDAYSIPEGLIEPPSEVKFLRDNTTYFCQIIELPHSINYTLAANYKKAEDGGDIKAAILTMLDGPDYPQPTSAECDLPEHTSTDWGTCTVNTDYGLAGQNLVCVYSSNGTDKNFYDVQVDSGQTDTAYKCTKEDAAFSCTSAGLSDYLIKVKGAEYSMILDNQIDFLKWRLSPDSVLMAFWKFVGSSEPWDFTPICTDLECVVEMKFIADGTGHLTISGLDIDYTDSGGPGETRVIYDMLIAPSMITHVAEGNSSVDLNETGAIVEIPLSIFNITIPSSFAKTGTSAQVRVDFNAEQANETFDVPVPGETVGSEKMIDETKTALTSLAAATDNTGLILKILDMEGTIAAAQIALSDFETRLASGDSAQLQSEIRSFRASLPKDIIFEGTLIDMQYVEPDDITTDLVPADKKTDTYFLQEKVDVKASISPFVITDFSDTQSRYALIKKEITPKEPLTKVDIYEVIEKSVADSVEDIDFEEPPSKVVKEDPIVKWFFPSLSAGSKKNINYVVKTEFAVPMSGVKTIIAATPEEEEEENGDTDEAECGDGVCTNILEDEISCPEDCKSESPIYTIALILVIALILGLYTLFYKGKYSLQSLFKKTPFKSEAELNSIKTFIKNSRAKKMSDIQIKKRLLNKGWTKKQIDHALAELDKTKPVEKPLPKKEAKQVDLKPMQQYIKLALGKKMKKEIIAKKLVAQGWDKKLVKKELGMK